MTPRPTNEQIRLRCCIQCNAIYHCKRHCEVLKAAELEAQLRPMRAALLSVLEDEKA